MEPFLALLGLLGPYWASPRVSRKEPPDFGWLFCLLRLRSGRDRHQSGRPRVEEGQACSHAARGHWELLPGWLARWYSGPGRSRSDQGLNATGLPGNGLKMNPVRSLLQPLDESEDLRLP